MSRTQRFRRKEITSIRNEHFAAIMRAMSEEWRTCTEISAVVKRCPGTVGLILIALADRNIVEFKGMGRMSRTGSPVYGYRLKQGAG
jgi:hypothetical protein